MYKKAGVYEFETCLLLQQDLSSPGLLDPLILQTECTQVVAIMKCITIMPVRWKIPRECFSSYLLLFSPLHSSSRAPIHTRYFHLSNKRGDSLIVVRIFFPPSLWYFVTKIVLTYCEKKLLYVSVYFCIFVSSLFISTFSAIREMIIFYSTVYSREPF